MAEHHAHHRQDAAALARSTAGGLARDPVCGMTVDRATAWRNITALPTIFAAVVVRGNLLPTLTNI
jgi:hypothetical protein